MPDPVPSDPAAACLQEIDELHRFFEAWFAGRLPATSESFARVDVALSEDFEIVGPSGDLSARGPLLERLRAAHGVDDALRIRVENGRVRTLEPGGLLLAVYEEWHETEDGPRGRLSSALFRPWPETPNGLQWLHVHETWLPTDD